ncbi:DUF5722 domain-containing protein [Paenibacillus arenilitoris]|uniref:DUF5722 domain-containing protein n=1 Tax=Paenibacillus arenilitoris TaxID=2772299 RepID=A0A927CJ98_9BACL|nr:DUF5722 domain-containing protein [Paenibacillus arenilitoris]MBD2867216.1 hypothetical protein [Paenibacillus arenilitoris]
MKTIRFKWTAALTAAVLVCQLLLAAAAAAGPYDPGLSPSPDAASGTAVYPARIINDFNSAADVATWSNGENTKSVSYVTSLLNGPNSVYEGAGALEQQPENVKVHAWRTIYRDFAEPLDLSDYRYLAFAANSWGWQPVDYMLRVRLHGADGVKESLARIHPDSWSTVFLDLSQWAGRSGVTKMEIAFMQNFDLEGVAPGAPGYDYWDGRFQIDLIAATNVLDLRFSKDGDAEGFSAASGSVEAGGGKLRWQVAGTGDALTSGAFALPIGERNAVSVTMSNGTPASRLKLQWTTAEDPEWDEEKSKTFEIEPNAGMSVVDMNLSDKASWGGTLRQFRIEPALNEGESGLIEVDEAEFKILPQLPPEYVGSMASPLVDGAGSAGVSGTVGASAAEAHAGGVLKLYELPTYADPQGDDSEWKAIGTLPVQESFAFSFGLGDGERSRLYSKFAVALESGGERLWVDAPRYIVNADALAANRYPFPEAKSKKGLQVQYTDDAEELGISHAALNVAYDQMLYLTNSDPAGTIPYEFEGRTYYFKKNTVESLDRQIKSLSDNDMIVSLILIMYRNLDPSTPNSVLIHPDSEPGGTVYAVNTKTAEGVGYYGAITNFIAERYTRSDEAYGRAVNFIVGNEVGQNKVWNNMGPKLIHEYVEDYARTLRLTDTIVRSNYEHGRVYISLDHFWDENLPSDSLWKYDNKNIVDLLTAHLKAGGDIPWNMAFHPYPENLFDPKFWEDETAEFDFHTKRITFKNLSVLVDYLRQPDMLVDGEMRRIILSEQGFHSLDNSPASQQIQAAAYAYAYYIVKFLDGVDSFILHRHVDHAFEGGLNLGLWSNLPGETATPDKKKAAYGVFRDIDTAKSLEATAFAKEIIGIDSWEEAIPGFDPAKLADRKAPAPVPVSLPKKAIGVIPVSNFEGGTDGWTLADNSSGVALHKQEAYGGEGSLQVGFSALAKMWRGADLKLAEPVDARRTPILNLALKVKGDFAADRPYYAKIKAYSGAKSAEGIVALHEPGEWTYAAVDLKGWSGLSSIDRVKVWMSSPTTDNWSGSFLIDEVSFSRGGATQGGVVNLDVAPRLTADPLQSGSQIEVTVTNYDEKDLTGVIKVSSEALTLTSKELRVNLIKTGQSRTFLLTVGEYVPPAGGGGVELTFDYRNTVIRKTIASVKDNGEQNVPEGEKLLYNFENNLLGWSGAANIETLRTVETFPNGPAKPALGSYALNARSAIAEATAWKSVKTSPSTPLDLSDAKTFFYHINSYGGVPNATYETRLILTGSDGTSRTVTAAMSPDRWNRIEADIADWQGRSSVASIEIGFRAVGNSLAWNPEIQYDYIGYEK